MYNINHLKMKRRRFYLKTQFVPRSKHFISVINPISYILWGRSHCLFPDKYRTHKYSVGRKYNS